MTGVQTCALPIYFILASLPPSYGNFISNYHMHGAERELNELCGMPKTAECDIKKCAGVTSQAWKRPLECNVACLNKVCIMHHILLCCFPLDVFQLGCFQFEFQTKSQTLFHACHVTMCLKHVTNKNMSNCFTILEFTNHSIAPIWNKSLNVIFTQNSFKFKPAQIFEIFKNKHLCTWAFCVD